MIEKLEAEKTVVAEKNLKGVFDDDMAKELLSKNKQNINLARFELTEMYGEELDIQALLAYANQFIRTLENAWYSAQINGKVRLQKWIFPEGVKIVLKVKKSFFELLN